MTSETLSSFTGALEGDESLREFTEREGKRAGANVEDMYTGFLDGERYFVKSDLPQEEKAAHLSAAPLMEQFDHAPDILYDPETEEIAVSKLGDDPRSPNSAAISDSSYSRFAPVDEEAFYEVAAERWVLGDSNVYDNILVESVSPADLKPGNEREVYLHDFDHAGKNSSKGRKRGFREAFDYVADKLGIDFNMRRLQNEVGELAREIDVETYRDDIEQLEESLEDDLYRKVHEHSERIAGNVEYAREVF